MNGSQPIPPPASDRGLRLAPFARADFPRIISWIPDEVALLQWAGPVFSWPLDAAQLERYLLPADPWPVGEPGTSAPSKAAGSPLPPPRSPSPARLIWTAIDVANGEAVGHVELNVIDLRHRSTTLSRVLIGPAHRGRGFAREMISLVLPIAFDDLALHRVDLQAFAYNEPALRTYRSLGFTREGVLRDVRIMDGVFVDSVIMSLLEDEWRARTRAGADAEGD